VTFRDELSVTRSQVEPIASPSSPLDEALQVRRVPLGGSALSQALQQGTVGRAWYAPRPATAEAWLSHMVSVRENMQQVDWLTALAPAFAVTGAAAERLAQAAARGVVVTTGQQPGLFG